MIYGLDMKLNQTEASKQKNLAGFLNGFACVTGICSIRADEQWAGYSRSLSVPQLDEIEAGGFDAGVREGKNWSAWVSKLA